MVAIIVSTERYTQSNGRTSLRYRVLNYEAMDPQLITRPRRDPETGELLYDANGEPLGQETIRFVPTPSDELSPAEQALLTAAQLAALNSGRAHFWRSGFTVHPAKTTRIVPNQDTREETRGRTKLGFTYAQDAVELSPAEATQRAEVAADPVRGPRGLGR